ncbi:sigma-70 family RNA polymerase sigma factor [Cellulomonas sp. DKR-3]|uniref:Sigma-70 family RNA polymerase sigma factor n=1 Tax=Cellulomonas fulva TaxID=2835530 RepID=A0ABS5U041_9CELL|nr:sigma-70 family RNA polymerase sigma factor [Cellulomonas fulva]MBT0994707.1 sigma-70 family RNA polymerase sigma factor [Cellulomonas fulva]
MTDDPPDRQFERLFRDLVPQVRGFVRRNVPPAAVDDVVSEVFLVVWRRWDALPGPHDERRAWVFTVARFTIAREHDRARAEQERNRRWSLRAATEPVEDAGALVDGRDAVAQVLRTLPAAEREALACVAVDGLSMAQTAERLGCSVSAVTSRLARARRRLESALAPDGSLRPDDAATSTDPPPEP